MKIEIGEIWKDIYDYPNYQVSNLGRIKSKERYSKVGIKNQQVVLRKERILKQQTSTKKYLQVRLYNDNRAKTLKVHRLVAEAFISNPNNYPQVNHIDGNKLNNRVDNLEWCNCIQNMKHSYDIGLRDKEILRKNMSILGKKMIDRKGHHIRKVFQIDKNNNEIIKVWNSITEASKSLNISNTSIQNVCAKKSKTAGGYIWKYV